MEKKILKSFDEKSNIAIFEWGRNVVHCNVENAVAHFYKPPITDIPDVSIYLGFENWNEVREMVGMKKVESIIKEKQVEKKLNTPDWAKLEYENLIPCSPATHGLDVGLDVGSMAYMKNLLNQYMCNNIKII